MVSDDGKSLSEQLRAISVTVSALATDQQLVWARLRRELAGSGIVLVDAREIGDNDREWLEHHFLDSIFPVLTPLAIDPAHPFPFIPNLGLTVALALSRKSTGQRMTALMRMPMTLDRFIRLPGEPGIDRFISLDQAVTLFVARLFPGYLGRRAGGVPGHPRLRHRGRGRGRGPRPLLRERAEAPPARIGHPARDRGGDAGGPAHAGRRPRLPCRATRSSSSTACWR